MITEWSFSSDHDGIRQRVKNIIKDNNYTSIDIGAAANFWSYPECKTIADAVQVNKPDVTQFKINLEGASNYAELLSYVEKNKKFDFSICSHTLEDIFNPIDIINLLQSISTRGFIALPSKFDEFTYLFENKYLGNSHHKQLFDIIDNKVVIFPKYSFIEVDQRTKEIRERYKGKELYFFWSDSIDYEIFGNGTPFHSDGELISTYFAKLNQNIVD